MARKPRLVSKRCHLDGVSTPGERKLDVQTDDWLRSFGGVLKVWAACPRCSRPMRHNMGRPWDPKRKLRVRRCKFCLNDYEVLDAEGRVVANKGPKRGSSSPCP
jgi:hypothetical protein